MMVAIVVHLATNDQVTCNRQTSGQVRDSKNVVGLGLTLGDHLVYH